MISTISRKMFKSTSIFLNCATKIYLIRSRKLLTLFETGPHPKFSSADTSTPSNDGKQREETKQLLLSFSDLDLSIHSLSINVPHTYDSVYRGGIFGCGVNDVECPVWMSPAVYYNSRSLTSKRLDEVCPGCHQKFTSVKDVHGRYSFDYLVHLVEECDGYKKLNLIKACNECNFKFINERSYNIHETLFHSRKPSWMPPQLYEHRNIKDVKEIVYCAGCGKSMERGIKTGIFRIEDYVHMIEECDGYKKLDLVHECKECNYKFINKHSYLMHESTFHSKKPDWMAKTIFKNRNLESEFQLVNCLGCGKELRRRIKDRRYFFEDYIHMIEECDAYKELNLIKECDICNLKFINKQSFNKHKCEIHNHIKGSINEPKDDGRPPWMTPSMFKHSQYLTKKVMNEKCPGCHKIFNAAKDEKGQLSFDYLVHIMDQCKEYEKLNLIKECHECKYKFVNESSYRRHMTIKHKQKPEWMPPSLYRKKVLKDFEVDVPCSGCGMIMKKDIKRGIYRFEDYVHMIEDCEPYKKLKLIRGCKKCNFKFIDSRPYLLHMLKAHGINKY